MKRKDLTLIVGAIVIMAVWTLVDRLFVAKHFPVPPPRPAAATNETGLAVESTGLSSPAASLAATGAAPAAVIAAPEAVNVPDDTPAETAELRNERMILRITSRGAAVEDVTLLRYPRFMRADTNRVVLVFTNAPALSYSDLPGLSGRNFTIVEKSERRIVLRRDGDANLTLQRTYELGTNYLVRVKDEFLNRGTAQFAVPAHRLRTGDMLIEAGHRNMIGFTVLGVDTLTGGTDGVKHWGDDLVKWFEKVRDAKAMDRLPLSIATPPLDEDLKEKSVDWIAAKNKYFLQIVAPVGGADAGWVHATRSKAPGEEADPALAPYKGADVVSVAGELRFTSELLVAPGSSHVRAIDYYVGPKKYEELAGLRSHQVNAMEFGYWRAIGKLLLQIMNFLHDKVIQNYGIAIMLLTVIVRTVFWPLTHKSTMSMKRMSKLQPQMNAIREKFKANPQKMQAEIMALYRANKVNPFAGCLPLLIQIPVFIALFYVLRSAIELRYASFLWIRDLSEPERIFDFGFAIPILGWDSLNLLPIAMTVTMIIQMKVTPTAGDPQQQKIMMTIMPAMMLAMLYNYASGLALYWTTTNIISIAQQFYYRHLNKKEEAAEKAGLVAKPAGKK